MQVTLFLETIRLGLRNLRAHLLRTTLTSLGIILGVAAVILMVAIGEGNKQRALRDIEALGATNIILRSSRPPEAGAGSERRSLIAQFGLTAVDLRRLREFLPDAAHIVPLKAVGSEISRGARRAVSQAFGTVPALREIAGIRLQPGGRYLAEEDLEMAAPVAVVGAEIGRLFFPLEDPIGAEFRIDDRIFRVIGVLKPVGFAGGAGTALVGRDLNLDIHIPLSTARMEFGDLVIRRQTGSFSGEEVEISEIYVTTTKADAVIPTAGRVRRIAAAGHPGMMDIEVIVPWELLESVKRTTLAMNLLLTSIAAISLLVGGIGIMNIMLASVVERTREIGIRRALGATRRHIVAQFLVETGSLSSVGGVLGIVLGVLGASLVSHALPWLRVLPSMRDVIPADAVIETQLALWPILLAFSVAVGTGIAFGIYPAMLASRQDPIAALRHD